MAAPTSTTRNTPSGLPLRDGFATLITFANDPDISLWEKATTPPGIDGQDTIDTTTFHNTAYRTKWPRALVDITDGQFTCAYDPAARTQIMAQVNVNQCITVTYNDGSTDAFWGYLQSFIPQEHSDGEQPEAQVTFVITNTDGSFAEYGPATASVTGT